MAREANKKSLNLFPFGVVPTYLSHTWDRGSGLEIVKNFPAQHRWA